MTLDTIPEALTALAAGRPVVVVDDECRENEGDIIFAAEKTTPELMAFTIRYTSGVVCVPLPGQRADRLGLPPMVRNNQDAKGTAYTLSCDAATGISTGISAADRSRTVSLLAADSSTAADLVRPGHIFPLRAAPGGVLERRGHTEAAVDLCTLAGLSPVGVIAELNHDDGTMMRLPALRDFATAHQLPLVSIEQLVDYIQQQAAPTAPDHTAPDAAAQRAADPATGSAAMPGPRLLASPEVPLPSRYGQFTIQGFTEVENGWEHCVVRSAIVPENQPPLVRLHSECLTGDVFGSRRCDCGEQLEQALQRIASEGGMVIYLRGQEGRGIGLDAKLRAYALQDDGADTVDANIHLGLPVDARNYAAAAEILRQHQLHRVRLLTNNPDKVQALAAAGIQISEQVPLNVQAHALNSAYLHTKAQRMGHLLSPTALNPTGRGSTALGSTSLSPAH